MKRCPTCERTYGDELVFCLDDGSELINSSPTVTPTVFAYDTSETPTRIITKPDLDVDRKPAGGSPWLYLLIGVLVTALIASVAFAAYLYFSRGTDEKASNENKSNSLTEATGRANPSPSASPTTAATPAVTPTPMPPLPPPAHMSPAGTWSGAWSGRSADFAAVMALTENAGAVSGRILWTLRRSSNPQKAGKAGLAATEYVQGTFDAKTGRLRLRGVRKDDPYGLVILDTYDLLISDNGSSISGRSRSGSLQLRR